MKSRRDIKDRVMPSLLAPGMAESIQNLVGFNVVWSRLDYEQTYMVYLAHLIENGNVVAIGVLEGMKKLYPK